MAARELGNALGNPLARPRSGGGVVEYGSFSFQADVVAGSTGQFTLPFAVEAQHHLDIRVVIWDGSTTGNTSALHHIPPLSGNDASLLFYNSANSHYARVWFDAVSNSVILSATGANFSGAVVVSASRRSVRNFGRLSGSFLPSDSPGPLPFEIVNFSKTWLGCVGSSISTMGVGGYLLAPIDPASTNSWHVASGSTRGFKVTSPREGMCRPSGLSGGAAFLMEFA